MAVPTDITSVAQCQTLVKDAMDGLGRVDVLVNNAGVGGEYTRPPRLSTSAP